ncbi:Seipin-like protein [Nitzschia inconspicua]|uniref:Seipin-like protein n=1 Tax=Nitzschia inconspicua TaxID=303405 RepID=A0A9K3L6L8_9STRA|nr:Seipin-like protein [Nitzschia inconspicua]
MVDRSQRRDSAAAMGLLLEALASSTSLIRQRQEYYGLGLPPPPPPPPHGNPFVFEQYGPATESTFIGFFPWIKRLIWYLFVGTILLCSSLCLYGVFYNAVMPGLHASEKLYFYYEGMVQRPDISIVNATTTKSNDNGKNILENDAETCDNNNTINMTINETDVQSQTTPISLYSVDDSNNHDHDLPSMQQQQQQRQLLLLKQRRSAQATADLFSRQDQWIAHHPDIIPNPKAQTRILPRNVAHYIEVVLDLPESERNRKVGIFGVLVELQSNNGTLLASSLRTARMPHESKWIAVVRKTVCIVPILLGALQESRRVLVPSFRFFVESERLPLRYVTVSVIMSPEKTQQNEGGEGDCLEVLYGYLHVGKELTEFQRLLKEWFFTCMVFGTMFFYGIQVMLLLGLQAYRAIQRERREREEIHSWEENDASDILPFDDTADSTSLHGRVERGSRPDNYPPMEENFDGNHSHHNTEEEFYVDDRNDAVFFECDGSFPDGQEGEWEDLPTETTGSFGHAPPPPTFGATRIPDD